MLCIILTFLILWIVALVIQLRKKNKQIQNIQSQIKEMQIQSEKEHQEIAALENVCDTTWNYANTIHLYAALTMEESTSEPVKEKQKEIIQMSEKIIQIIHIIRK